ncbi:hypothetical protein BIV24_22895 [Streptomyces colonosanans]|uniref:Uncharacterized protein n=1 Tax=Streptomyces colonosanans TaxID=1428652 RepID=A0A1S2P5R2_9ACTN|nr:hypothetical protein BIV24_22895 [Streptomyces colonosanans]
MGTDTEMASVPNGVCPAGRNRRIFADLNERFDPAGLFVSRFRVGFVVAGESAVVHEPAEGPLDDPASRDYFEPFDAGVALDDFDVDAEAAELFDHKDRRHCRG